MDNKEALLRHQVDAVLYVLAYDSDKDLNYIIDKVAARFREIALEDDTPDEITKSSIIDFVRKTTPIITKLIISRHKETLTEIVSKQVDICNDVVSYAKSRNYSFKDI